MRIRPIVDPPPSAASDPLATVAQSQIWGHPACSSWRRVPHRAMLIRRHRRGSPEIRNEHGVAVRRRYMCPHLRSRRAIPVGAGSSRLRARPCRDRQCTQALRPTPRQGVLRHARSGGGGTRTASTRTAAASTTHTRVGGGTREHGGEPRQEVDRSKRWRVPCRGRCGRRRSSCARRPRL